MAIKFTEQQRKHQIEWRKANIRSTEIGRQNKSGFEHIVPKKLWKETLWYGIRQELLDYLKQKNIQHHTGTHNLLSSWVVCANLYFPVKVIESFKHLMLEFLKQKVSSEITEITDVELEFAYPNNDELHPSRLLGEMDGLRGSGQTSPDVAFMVKTKNGNGIVLTECKYMEHSFYKCSARRTDDKTEKKGNPDPDRCMQPGNAVDYKSICHQSVWGRKYWEYLDISDLGNKILTRCPASTAGYQLLRQQALAEGIMRSGRFHLVASAVALDGRNMGLINCLKKTGLDNFREQWGKLFNGQVLFRSWTHQEWYQFVKNSPIQRKDEEWLRYLHERYGY